jgi:undecaprenyl-diphosphatase
VIEQLEKWDRELFIRLNGMHADWLDQPMFYMSDELTWIPLYLFFLYALARFYGWRVALTTLLAVAVVVTIADRSSVELFKEVFKRYRPSRNLELYDQVHVVNGYRGGKFGFVSSHAANFFGIATLLYLMFRRRVEGWALLLFLWAGLIAYTRIYLGVHYPADIVCGAALGVFTGILVFYPFNRFLWKLPSKT